MKINDIITETTSGGIAVVPVTHSKPIKRGPYFGTHE